MCVYDVQGDVFCLCYAKPTIGADFTEVEKRLAVNTVNLYFEILGSKVRPENQDLNLDNDRVLDLVVQIFQCNDNHLNKKYDGLKSWLARVSSSTPTWVDQIVKREQEEDDDATTFMRFVHNLNRDESSSSSSADDNDSLERLLESPRRRRRQGRKRKRTTDSDETVKVGGSDDPVKVGGSDDHVDGDDGCLKNAAIRG